MKQIQLTIELLGGTPGYNFRETRTIVRTINPEKPELASKEAWNAYYDQVRFLKSCGYQIEGVTEKEIDL